MAEKEISNIIKLQIEAGKATPAPPVGPALGSSGVNIMQFVKEFNDRTANQPGMIIPVVISPNNKPVTIAVTIGLVHVCQANKRSIPLTISQANAHNNAL